MDESPLHLSAGGVDWTKVMYRVKVWEEGYVSLETRSRYPAIRNISTMEKRRMVEGVIEEHERLPPQMARINMDEHEVFIRKSNHMGEALAKEMIKWWCHLSLAERAVMEMKFDLSSETCMEWFSRSSLYRTLGGGGPRPRK